MCLQLHVRTAYAYRSARPHGLDSINQLQPAKVHIDEAVLTKRNEELGVIRVLFAIIRHADQTTVYES